jgi:hypothetical protein
VRSEGQRGEERREGEEEWARAFHAPHTIHHTQLKKTVSTHPAPRHTSMHLHPLLLYVWFDSCGASGVTNKALQLAGRQAQRRCFGDPAAVPASTGAGEGPKRVRKERVERKKET